jgi:WD40 repeat protein
MDDSARASKRVSPAGSAARFQYPLVVALVLSLGAVWGQAAQANEAALQEVRPVFSRDGTKLASAAADGGVTVLDLESGRALATLGDGLGAAAALAFSPDGQVLAGAKDNAVSLWDVADGTEKTVLQVAPGGSVTRLAFSPGGDRLAAIVDGAMIVVWELQTESVGAVLSRQSEAVTEIAFSADGGSLASIGGGAQITLWELGARPSYRIFASPTGAAMTGLAFSPVGTALAGADEDASITLWDADSGERMELAAHRDLIKRLTFSPNGAKLASEGMDARLLVWDVVSGQDLEALPARFGAQVTGLAFSPDGATLASIGDNNEILLWCLSSGALTQVLAGHSDPVSDLAFSSSGQTLASVGTNGQVIVWRLPAGTERFAFQIPGANADASAGSGTDRTSAGAAVPSQSTQAAQTSTAVQTSEATSVPSQALGKKARNRIRAIAVAPNAASIVVASDKGVLPLRVGIDDQLTETSGASLTAATAVAYSPTGNAFYSVGRDTQVRRWTPGTGQLAQSLHGHEHPISAVAVSHDDRFVASAGEETRIMLWSSAGKLVGILSAHRDFVNALAFSPIELKLVSGGKDGRIFVWDPNNPKPLQALLGHSRAVTALAYSHDGRTVASASADTTVKVWDASTGRELASLAHPAPVQAVAVSQDDRYLASAGGSAQVYIWDLKAGGQLVKVLSGAPDLVASLAFLPNGRLLAGGEDGSLTLWDVAANRLIRTKRPAALDATAGGVELPSPLSPERITQPPQPLGDRHGASPLIEFVGRVLDWVIPAANAQGLPDPNAGPGGPILVIDSTASLFGKYYAEILRTEGFNAFSVADVATVTPEVLSAYDLVILAEMSLSAGQVTMLTDWVNAGGNLIAMHPDPQLAGLLGVAPVDPGVAPPLSEGYVLVDTAAPPGNGIVAETMQFHGTASRFSLDGATAVATLFSDPVTATANPAVTLRTVTNGGQAAAFAYDLATSIVYTRQGNPAWANQERDGLLPQRSDDKYYGDALGDPKPDWVNLDKIAIPQADEQQRLLANLIIQMTLDRKPLPRFWYFPRGEKAVVIMAGDDHAAAATSGTVGRWDQYLAAGPADCSVENWECVRGTSYIYPNELLTDEQAKDYEAQGFEVGLHVNTNCADYTEAQLQALYDDQIGAFSAQWPSVSLPSTQRHHCVVWTDWAEGAKVQLQHGVRLDTTYYVWPPDWVLDRPGFVNGSGMPMRFADLDGSLIDVYQAETQMTDESGQSYPFTVNTLLDRALGPEGYYGVFAANAHTDVPVTTESDAILASAMARGVPIVTSRQMLQWLDGRNSSSFGAIAWDGDTLGFTVAAAAGANGLQVLVPMLTGAGVVTDVALDEVTIPHGFASRKGIDYVSFSATGGSYAVSYGPDTTPPTVIAFSPPNGAVDVQTMTRVTATFSEPMDPATLAASGFQLRDGTDAPVGASASYDADSRTATLAPSTALEPDTTYTATLSAVEARDVSGNAMANDFVWAFTTAAPLPCPCSVWSDSDTPSTASASDSSAVEVGVKFRSDTDGFITGVRFYKGSANTGTHIGNLWTASGTNLASATFITETEAGWQQVDFPTAIPITANTVYVASYHAPSGGYAVDLSYFSGGGVDMPPLHLLADGESGGNGVYQYGPSAFPNQSAGAANYWVDVVFATDAGPDVTPPTVTASTPAGGATGIAVNTTVTVTFSEPMDDTTITTSTVALRDAEDGVVPAMVVYAGATRTATLIPNDALTATSTYTANVQGGEGGVKDLVGNALDSDVSWSFTTAPAGSGVCATPCSLWADTETPALLAADDTTAVELGVKFRSDVDGFITGLRFYKSAQNTGTHVGSLWSGAGQLLAQATFTNETALGWQHVSLATPVAIAANTVYVASYHAPLGRYSADAGYFTSAYTNGPLRALADGENGGNGVYLYGSGGFPTSAYGATNYWVDVVLTTSTDPDTTPPAVTATSPGDGAVDVASRTVVTATFSEPMDSDTINAATFELRDGGGALVGATVSYDAVTRAASLNPSAALSLSTQYAATIKGGEDGAKDLAGNALVADLTWTFTTAAVDPCAAPANQVVAENCQEGSPPSEWDISGAGDASIQGFATDISVNWGQIIDFKIDTDATNYRLDIYRLGYYGGDGARKVATVTPSVSLPQNQPACVKDDGTRLLDCGNWAVSASWSIPTNATSGIYVAKAIRDDSGGASHIVFVVRDDDSTSDVLVQTSDTTWQAYNSYGGDYIEYPDYGYPTTRAFKGSYNRPFYTRQNPGGLGAYNWLFHAEYPMVRWLEANGFDVSYFSAVDSDRRGDLIPNHKVFASVGHDEYWSGQQRTHVEAAREAGVHLAFFSGNEVYRKIRWEESIDGSGTHYRTMVCYKESNADEKIDPFLDVWTGSWRDARFSPPADGGMPENALSGTLFGVAAVENDGISLTVPEANGKMRFWRGTPVAALGSGQTATLGDRVIGYEFDEDIDNGFRPPGLIQLSSTTTPALAMVVGDNIFRGQDTYPEGTATHALTLYKHASGALVFSAGTVQWSWGLDGQHDGGGSTPEASLRQATVNLLADMGVQPATLQPDLLSAAASADAIAPSSVITSPANGVSLPVGTPFTITGTATDAGGVVGAVEVSVDGGVTWHPGDGLPAWSYTWTPMTAGSVSIFSRAVDDSGNLQSPATAVSVTTGSNLDSDGDGVNDALDQCPSTPAGESVDTNGCSATQRDSDTDGVNDALDQCASTPAGESVDINGCSVTQRDSDNDGINDALDQCPSTPTGEPVDPNGCSAGQRDDDGDGVANAADLCPGTLSGDAADLVGCSASQVVYFSTLRPTNPPGTSGVADNADVYTWNGISFARVLDVTAWGVPAAANVDGLSVKDGVYYLSFAAPTIIRGVSYDDEDIVAYDPPADIWSLYFDGTAHGLGSLDQLDIDAFDIVGGVLCFSTAGNANPPGVSGLADNADIYSWNGVSFSRVLDVTKVGVPGTANVDGLSVKDGVYYLSFTTPTIIRGASYDDEDIVAYDPAADTWSLYFDGTGHGLGASDTLDIDAFDLSGGILYFSTLGNTNPPSVSGIADDADVYSWNGASFVRVWHAMAWGVPDTANVDGLTVQGGVYYLSFTDPTAIRGVSYDDEDIVAYDPAADTWSMYFDGTAPGLGTSDTLDIDAFDVSGDTLYFSTVGNVNPPGVTGVADNSDVYSWNGASFARVLDATAFGVPATANVDGLTVKGGVHYLSFAGDITTIRGVSYDDEDIVAYDPAGDTWSLHFDGTAYGLGTSVRLDIDAFQIP